MFIPVVGYLAGQWTSPPHWRAAAWEYTLRSLTTLSAERLAEQLGAVLTARCTCFDSIEGSIGAYTPYSQWHGTARLGSAWRAATLRNAALVPVSYTHLTLPTTYACRSRWSPYH